MRELKLDGNQLDSLDGLLGLDSLVKLSLCGNALVDIDLGRTAWCVSSRSSLSQRTLLTPSPAGRASRHFACQGTSSSTWKAPSASCRSRRSTSVRLSPPPLALCTCPNALPSQPTTASPRSRLADRSLACVFSASATTRSRASTSPSRPSCARSTSTRPDSATSLARTTCASSRT